MLNQIEIQPVFHEAKQVLSAAIRGIRIATAAQPTKIRVCGKQFNFKSADIQQAKRQRKIRSQPIVSNLGGETGELLQRVQIQRLWVDAARTQTVGILLPESDERGSVEARCYHSMNLACFHESPSV